MAATYFIIDKPPIARGAALMWLVFLIVAVLGVLVLAVHVNLELASLDKTITGLADSARKHYERPGTAQPH